MNIEFRIFNKKTCKFIPVKNNGFEFQSSQELWLNTGMILNTEMYSIELFTGLYDKRNVKIYENDVVRFKRSHFELVPVDDVSFEKKRVEDGYDIGLVKYIAPKFIFSYENPRFLYDEELSNDTSRLEVIGNIHQNSNLFTK